MKLRWVPIVWTAALSAALLFGGWYAYRHYGVEQPLDRIAADIPGVENARSEFGTGSVVVEVTLSPEADLAEVYSRVLEDGARQIGGKTLELKPVGMDKDEALERAWRTTLFDVAEAMETRRYSGIREAMDELERTHPGVTVDTSMDDSNVYVRLREGDAAKFVILPRAPQMMGVWPNA